ncbi:unnamed protein product, partial [Polarella glacialis]
HFVPRLVALHRSYESYFLPEDCCPVWTEGGRFGAEVEAWLSGPSTWQLPLSPGICNAVDLMSMPSIPGAIMAFQGLPVPDQRYSQDPITSFMIRNIPCSLTRDSVKSQVDRNGFSGLYDNFQLPLGRKSSTGLRRANLGYAFINFLHAEHAARFRDIFDGYSFTGT